MKRWLEASMRFELPYDVYTSAVRTTLPTLGAPKRFDLKGLHYDERWGQPRDIYIEVKNVKTDSNLSTQWRDFVATTYSATHVAWQALGRDPELEFMFASTHAWSSSLYWSLTEFDAVKSACESRVDLMPSGGAADDRIRLLTERLFLWVVSRRQDDMTMGRKFRGYVMAKIGEGET